MPPPGGFGGMGSFGGRTAGVGSRGNAPGGSGGGQEARSRSRGFGGGIGRALEQAIGARSGFFSDVREAQKQRPEPVDPGRFSASNALAAFALGRPPLEEEEKEFSQVNQRYPPSGAIAQAGPHLRSVYSLPNRMDRAIGGFLGIESRPVFDRNMPGNIGIAGSLHPISLVGNALAGSGFVNALAALGANMPFTAANMVSTGLGNRGMATRAGSFAADFGIPTSFSLGTRPTRYSQAQAQAKARSGAALTAQDQLALSSIARDQQRQENMRASASDDSTQTPGAIAPTAPLAVLPTPAPPARAFRPASRGSRLLAGRDPSTGLDLLRTGQQAAVAQGLAPARPNVGVPGRPPRARALV